MKQWICIVFIAFTFVFHRFSLVGISAPKKKKKTSPPHSPQTPSRPLAPFWKTPRPLLWFSIRNRPPPPSWHLGLPLPFPRAEKIRNVHQVMVTKPPWGNNPLFGIPDRLFSALQIPFKCWGSSGSGKQGASRGRRNMVICPVRCPKGFCQICAIEDRIHLNTNCLPCILSVFVQVSTAMPAHFHCETIFWCMYALHSSRKSLRN